MGQWLSQRLGQQFIIENRPGAGGNLGAETAVNSAPDGYTLLMVPPAVAANAALYPHLSFDFIRDTAPVAGVVRVPNVVEVNPAVPVKTIPELIAYAKANPGKLSFASAGIGTASHLAGQLFNKMTGAQSAARAVPRRRAGDGRSHRWSRPGRVRDHDGVDRLYPRRPAAAAGGDHAATLRCVAGCPDRRQFVPGFEASSWFGVAAPKGTPDAIIESLNREINAGLADATIKARLADMGGMELAGSPADFGKLIAAETDKWGKVIREAGIKAE